MSTPEPPVSVGLSATVTGVVRYQPVEQADPLQEMVVAGFSVSIWISWDFTASALPALSVAKNFTVAVADTVNGVVYAVLDVVGVVPLVV